jgi:hypothetical protein
MVTIEPIDKSKPPEVSTIISPMARIAKGDVRLKKFIIPGRD